jgi:polyisoprenyl-phosphate glycosyltransferase
MNADLQHPPELLPAMIAKWREGYEDVYMVPETAGRDDLVERLGRAFLHRFSRELRLPAEGGDFRLLGAPAVAAIRRLPERARFMRGIYH